MGSVLCGDRHRWESVPTPWPPVPPLKAAGLLTVPASRVLLSQLIPLPTPDFVSQLQGLEPSGRER